jgi:hypothetical protein
MARFLVTIPETRKEYVHVEYEIEANNMDEVKKLIENYEFMDKAEYLETKDGVWGFEVEDVFYDEAKIEELKNG